MRKGSGIGTWKTRIWPSFNGVSGTRWRVWMIVASSVRVVVLASATRAKKRRIETALVVSSAPWSITFKVSSRPMMAAVTWMPPGAPAIGQRHLAAAERHLVARDRHRLQDGAADHALGLLVEIGVVVGALLDIGVRHCSLRRLVECCAPVALLDLLAQRPHRHQLGL